MRADTEDDDAGEAPGPAPTLERTASDAGGAYWRDGDGVWRYAGSDDEVPGARDLRLGELFDPPRGDLPPPHAVRLVPRAWVRRELGHPLAWVFDHASLEGRGDIEVPADVWDERAATVVAMAAPELHPHNLVGVDGVAALLGVGRGTVRSYLARGQMPPPVSRPGGSPLWSRVLIERWLPTRRRRADGA